MSPRQAPWAALRAALRHSRQGRQTIALCATLRLPAPHRRGHGGTQHLADDFFARFERVDVGAFELCYRRGIIAPEHLEDVPQMLRG